MAEEVLLDILLPAMEVTEDTFNGCFLPKLFARLSFDCAILFVLELGLLVIELIFCTGLGVELAEVFVLPSLAVPPVDVASLEFEISAAVHSGTAVLVFQNPTSLSIKVDEIA